MYQMRRVSPIQGLKRGHFDSGMWGGIIAKFSLWQPFGPLFRLLIVETTEKSFNCFVDNLDLSGGSFEKNYR